MCYLPWIILPKSVRRLTDTLALLGAGWCNLLLLALSPGNVVGPHEILVFYMIVPLDYCWLLSCAFVLLSSIALFHSIKRAQPSLSLAFPIFSSIALYPPNSIFCLLSSTLYWTIVHFYRSMWNCIPCLLCLSTFRYRCLHYFIWCHCFRWCCGCHHHRLCRRCCCCLRLCCCHRLLFWPLWWLVCQLSWWGGKRMRYFL